MPITYYTKEEYDKMKSELEIKCTTLVYEIKNLRNEDCRIGLKSVSCGSCSYVNNCFSRNKYFSK